MSSIVLSENKTKKPLLYPVEIDYVKVSYTGPVSLFINVP